MVDFRLHFGSGVDEDALGAALGDLEVLYVPPVDPTKGYLDVVLLGTEEGKTEIDKSALSRYPWITSVEKI